MSSCVKFCNSVNYVKKMSDVVIRVENISKLYRLGEVGDGVFGA
jgi:hypothetical protein